MVKVLANKAEWDKCHSDAGGKTVIVDFTATWCGPCRIIGPKFEDLSKKYTTLIFVKVDVDENDEIATMCGIKAMPTFMVFRGGEKVDEMIGADPKKLEALVEKHQ